MKHIVLIPAYEPDEKLVDFTAELRKSGFSVVVVNDGSNASYNPVFEKASSFANVIGYPENYGKGCALKTGMDFILKFYDENDIVVTADADGQHRLPDVLRVAEASAEHPDSLILGVRKFGKGTPVRSMMGNQITKAVFRFVTGQKISDTQTGLRAFKVGMIPYLCGIGGDRFEYETNMLLDCARNKIPMREVPIETVYLDGNAHSHFRTVRDSYLIYKEIIQFAASSFIGFLVDYTMYSILVLVTASMGAYSILFSNIFARVVSASVNFTLNRNVVFRHKGSLAKDALQYCLLAAAILAGNTFLLYLLVDVLNCNKYLAKVLIEILFFVISWLVQKFLIFRKALKASTEDGHEN